jgi:translation initiation factor IF-1
MKTLRRLQSSAPRSSCKLFGHRSNLLSSDYADLVLGFLPPKLRAKAAKTSIALKLEQDAAEFQGELAIGQHRGVVQSAAGKNFRVRSLLDNRLRDCRIKGHLKRHIQINSVVVFEPSVKFCDDDDHGNIVWRYFEKEVEKLQDAGLLPESNVLWPNTSDGRAIAPSARRVKAKPTSTTA